MANLTDRQVAGIAAQGTPSGTIVAEWVATARAENASFNPAQRGFANRWDVGIWQVNVQQNRDLIVEAKVSLENAASAMTSPLRNWEVTKAIYARQSWAAWVAIGKKRPIPSTADRAAAANPDYSVANAGGAVSGAPEAGVESEPGHTLKELNPFDAIMSGVKAVLDVVNRVGGWVSEPHNWVRVGYVAGGTALVIAAGAAVAQGTKTGQAVTGAATTVATKGIGAKAGAGPMRQRRT